ncbi:MAG: hypothetical protein H7Y32_11425 [Chloroflexales bacterium]|nr:hypothetical protein [Chloroflexales bacterium]
MRRQRLKALLIALLGVLLALTLTCGIGGAAVGRGALAPPDVNITFGPWRVVGGVSRLPQCAQLISPDCVDMTSLPASYIYTLWLFAKTNSQSWDSPTVRRLFTMQLRRS